MLCWYLPPCEFIHFPKIKVKLKDWTHTGRDPLYTSDIKFKGTEQDWAIQKLWRWQKLLEQTIIGEFGWIKIKYGFDIYGFIPSFAITSCTEKARFVPPEHIS